MGSKLVHKRQPHSAAQSRPAGVLRGPLGSSGSSDLHSRQQRINSISRRATKWAADRDPAPHLRHQGRQASWRSHWRSSGACITRWAAQHASAVHARSPHVPQRPTTNASPALQILRGNLPAASGPPGRPCCASPEPGAARRTAATAPECGAGSGTESASHEGGQGSR